MPNASAEVIPFALRLKQLYEQACREVCRRYGLTQTEFDILDHLGEGKGRNTVGEIACAKLIKKANVSTGADRLIRKGYLERRGDDRDRRLCRLYLTEEAAAPLQEILRTKREFLTRLFSPLSGEEKEVLYELWQKIMPPAFDKKDDLKGAVKT